MIKCGVCGWQVQEELGTRPCPGCGSPITFRIETDTAFADDSAAHITPLRSHRFAPEWFDDALAEAGDQVISSIPQNRGAKRREIVLSVCCMESYLFEWTFHDVLGGDNKRVLAYFPDNDKTGIIDRCKIVTKKLYEDGLLASRPDFGTFREWQSFRKLVDFRNGLVHANASRSETVTPDEPSPSPSLDDLDGMPRGWAVRVIVDLINHLHRAAGTLPPPWLVEP